MIYLTNNSYHLLIFSSARQHRLSPHYCVRKCISLSSFTDKVQITSASCPSEGVSQDISGGAWIQIQAYLIPKFYASSQCALFQFHGPCLCDSRASSTNYVDFMRKQTCDSPQDYLESLFFNFLNCICQKLKEILGEYTQDQN